jgi:hypothetical protein
MQDASGRRVYGRAVKHSDQDRRDPIEAPPNVPSGLRHDTDYSPSSEREMETLQDDQSSEAFDDPDIDRDDVRLLPGTGDYTDDGDVEVDPSEIHIPRHPDSDGVQPLLDEGRPKGV